MTPEEEYKHPKFHHPKKCGKPLIVCYRYTGKKPNRNRLERLRCPVHKKTLNKNGWEIGWAFGTSSRIKKHNYSEYGKRRSKK